MSGDPTPATLEALLEQRGVTGVERLVDGLGEDFNIQACLTAVVRYDREFPDFDAAPGLLVHRVREAAKARTRIGPVDGVGPDEAGITPRVLRAIRGCCNSPNGVTRGEARGMFEAKAERLRMPVDELIDRAMGRDWKVSMPHPAFDRRVPVLERRRLYERLVAGLDDNEQKGVAA